MTQGRQRVPRGRQRERRHWIGFSDSDLAMFREIFVHMFREIFGPPASHTQPQNVVVVKLQQGSLCGQSVVTGKQHSLQVDSGVEEP